MTMKTGDKVSTRKKIIITLEDDVYALALDAMIKELGHMAPVKSIVLITEEVYHA